MHVEDAVTMLRKIRRTCSSQEYCIYENVISSIVAKEVRQALLCLQKSNKRQEDDIRYEHYVENSRKRKLEVCYNENTNNESD